MEKLSNLPNKGAILENKLIEARVKTPDDLKKLGSKEAFLKIKNIDESACYNMLCALEGAIEGIRWHNLSDHKKKDLKKFFQDMN